MIIENSLRLALVSACLGSLAVAQTSVSSRVSIGLETPGSLAAEPLRKLVADLDKTKLGAVVSGSWESQILDAATRAGRQTIRRNLSVVEGYYTLTSQTGDILVARWTGTSNGGQEKAIWLWDTPSNTTFIVQLEPALLSVNELPRFLESLFVWDEYPVKLKSVRLDYGSSVVSNAVAEHQVVGTGTHLEQERGMFGWWMAGMSVKGDAYLSVIMTKPFFRAEYPFEAFVQERFPPLKNRLKVLPRAALFGELGKGYVRARRTEYPSRRDRIVMDELFSRGPISDIEVHRIVMGDVELNRSEWEAVNSRLNSFLQVAQQRGQVSSFAAAMERLCLTAKPDGAFSDLALSALYGAMGRNRVDFTRAALALINRDQFVVSSLRHLSAHAQSEEAIQLLSLASVKPEYETFKQDALKRMRDRMQSASPK